ncbi:MAG: DUF3887 domain-containing protein [Oscillospiraceae bacterium]|nr:DUF3887 domain-containing protein [Oscillospiraceae bacterium]
MKKVLNKLLPVLSLALLVLFITAGCGNDSSDTAVDTPPPSDTAAEEIPIDAADTNDTATTEVDWAFYNQRAEAFVSAMAEGDFDGAVAMFDDVMAGAAGAADMQVLWEAIIGEVGEFYHIDEIENIIAEEFFLCLVTTIHEHFIVVLRVVFNEDGFVAGFFVDDVFPLSD